jgi:4-hydroxybenzoate polyprenyltransferase
MTTITKNEKTFSIFSLGFIKSYIITMRPYLLFLSGVAGMAGLAISPSLMTFSGYFLCSLAFFFGYGFGQALTDCFQIDTDSISAPYRPLVKGLISPLQVLIVSILGLICIGVVLLSHNLQSIYLVILAAFGLLTYTFFKKNFWFTGPFWNSWIVMLLPIVGYLCTNEDYTFKNISEYRPLLFLCILSFFSYANFVLIGYLKDITADKETGYKTFPVVFGWTKSVWIGVINALISAIACYFLVFVYAPSNPFSIVFFAVSSVIAVGGLIHALITKNKTEINSAIAVSSTVRSFILKHLAVVIAFKPMPIVIILSIAFYLLFELVIYFRPQKEQI